MAPACAFRFRPPRTGSKRAGWRRSGAILFALFGVVCFEPDASRARLRFKAAMRSMTGAALRRFEEAVPRLQVAIEDMPVFQTPYRYLAACYGHMGLLDEARARIARLRAITPEVENHSRKRHFRPWLATVRLPWIRQD